jgi:hypothetical protein
MSLCPSTQQLACIVYNSNYLLLQDLTNKICKHYRSVNALKIHWALVPVLQCRINMTLVVNIMKGKKELSL